jgi:hypothetical protein
MIDDYESPIRYGPNRMTDIAWHDCNETRLGHLSNCINGHFKFALDDLVDLLLVMKVLVYGGAAREIVVSECHMGRVKIASTPARQFSFVSWGRYRAQIRANAPAVVSNIP